MKKISFLILLFLLVTSFILLVSFKRKDDIVFKEMSIDERVNNQLKHMTIEQKIAQMLIIDYESDTVDDPLISLLHNYPIGGVILMKPNITTYDKTKKFVQDLQTNSAIPLIISVDEEGGSVQRLKYLTDIEATDIPYMYDLGKTNDEKLAYNVGKIMAQELRTIGVNVAFAPVVDIYSNPNNKVIGKRSFSNDPNLVSKMANSLAKGLEDNGVIATYKHFPGHGDTDIDSHYNLPIISKTYDDLKNLELKPFNDAIANEAKMIMIGHISLPNIIGDNTPASLSKKIITDILKNDMNYQGLVITDALNMGALTNDYSDDEIYINAIEAGVDLLLMPNNVEEAIKCLKDNIDEKRIDKSVYKILKFKYEYLSKQQWLDKSYLGSSDHQKIISNIPVSK